MGECDLDGSSRLVTTTPGLLRFFFGDILFRARGWGGGMDGARWDFQEGGRGKGLVRLTIRVDENEERDSEGYLPT